MTDRISGRRLQKRRALYREYEPLCVICKAQGKYTPWAELDHIKALDNGGEDDDPSNWQGLCIACHKAKTAKDMGYKQKHQIGADGWPVGGA